MYSDSYDRLRVRFWNHKPDVVRSHAIRMVMRKGKSTLTGILCGTVRTDICLETPDGEVHRAHYRFFDYLDQDGNIVEDVPQDLTGRLVEIGSWVCFSERIGESGNGLSVGRVTKIMPSGALRVKAATATKAYVREDEVLVASPAKTLLLPVDDSALSLMILVDFDKNVTKDIG